MTNLEKIIKITDLIIDCIPGLSSLSNGFQALYKTALKVDVHNPVIPGPKASLQLHILSKGSFDHFIGSLPIFGNVYKLIELILSLLITGFKDNLTRAIQTNHKEALHLSLVCNPIKAEPMRAEQALCEAALSENTIFREIFKQQDTWSASTLMRALGMCFPTKNLLTEIKDDQRKNAEIILDYCKFHSIQLNQAETLLALKPLKVCLQTGNTYLLMKIKEILPKRISFKQIASDIKPSLRDLNQYYHLVLMNKENRLYQADLKISKAIINQILEMTEPTGKEVYDFISELLTWDDTHCSFNNCGFIEILLDRYEDFELAHLKPAILKALWPTWSAKKFPERNVESTERMELFTSLLKKWTSQINQANLLDLSTYIDNLLIDENN